jgi:hypothetical protein
MKEYLNNLINDINSEQIKIEKYSNMVLINSLKTQKLIKNNDNFNTLIEVLKDNHQIIIEVISEILSTIKDNYTFPFYIKSILTILDFLLDYKFKSKLNLYNRYMIKANFLFGNIILPVLQNPNYNGIITNEIISDITKDNLDIIVSILNMMLSGKLFSMAINPCMTIFNQYIIEIIPIVFQIVENAIKDFILPELLNKLIETINDINDINREIDDIKNIIKSNTLNIEKKFKNFLSKEEVKNELNNIQIKYEKIISGIFEYFLKYKNKNVNINNYKSQEVLILEIPIKSYNLMIENNMNSISSIGESIESWNLYVNNELDYNNDSIFQEIIDLTNIYNLNDLNEYNNISDLVNNESMNNLINKNANNSITTSNNFVYNENNNENDNENNNENDNKDNNEDDNDNEKDNETESNKNETQTNPPQENKYQYSFDNQQ